jgi:WD40 repeat protein
MTHKSLPPLILLALLGCRTMHPPVSGVPSSTATASVTSSLSQARRNSAPKVLSVPDCGGVAAIAFSPDGKVLAVGYDNGAVGFWSLGEGRLSRLTKVLRDSVTDVAFSMDGKSLVSGSEDGTAKVWEAVTGKLKMTLRGHQAPVESVAFAPDGKTLATGGGDSTVRIWDTATWSQKRVLQEDAGPEAREEPPIALRVIDVAFSPDGKWLAAGHRVTYRGEPMQSADYVSVTSTRTWKRKHALCYLTEVIDRVRSVAFSPDSRFLIAGHDRSGAGGRIERWDVGSGERQTLVKDVEPGIDTAAFALGGTAVVIVGVGPEASLWDTKTGKRIATLACSNTTGALAIAPGGRIAAIGDDDGKVTLWNLPQDPQPGNAH